MHIFLPPLEIGDEEGFTPTNDIFGLKSLGDGMANLIANVDDPLVIAFNGQWGSGKTVFLKMWAGELRKAGFPVIYFDAFENDYVEDAFAALAREVVSLTESKEATGETIAKTFKKKAIELGKIIGKAGVKIGVKVAIRASTAGLASDKDVVAAIDEVSDESSDVAERYMEEILSAPNKQKETVQSFREILSSLPALLALPAKGEKQKPLVFVIDELDRCKPLFALQLLERIKHFMAVPNVHFVLGIHLSQLQNSVKVAYGASVDAATYLQKFINLTITMPEYAGSYESKLVRHLRHIYSRVPMGTNDGRFMELLNKFLLQVLEHNNMSLRTLERVVANATICLAYAGDRTLPAGPIVAGLCVLKTIRPDLFVKAKAGHLEYGDIEELFGFTTTLNALNKDNSAKPTWEQCWWLSCTLKNIPTNVVAKISEQFHGNSIQREGYVREVANEIVDRMSVN